jgi:hypothetical protein
MPLSAQAAGAAGHDPGIESDHPLVGIWAATLASGDAVTGDDAREIGMAIRADGTMLELGSRPLGGKEWSGEGERAYFQVSRNILLVSVDGERWAPFVRFRFTNGGDLVFTYLEDESRQTWHRIS